MERWGGDSERRLFGRHVDEFRSDGWMIAGGVDAKQRVRERMLLQDVQGRYSKTQDFNIV